MNNDSLFNKSLPADALKSIGSISTAWKAPSNIALVKYWGKRPNQIPQNPSLSFSLSACFTSTTLTISYSEDRQPIVVNGKKDHPFAPKLTTFFNTMVAYFPFLEKSAIAVNTENSFPHSVGIASSASAFASIALCLCEIEQRLMGNEGLGSAFLQKASFIARLGSGSASRSVYGAYQVWGYLPELPNSTNDYAIPVTPSINPMFLGLRDAVLVVSTEPKSLSSTNGHALMVDHPYADARYAEAKLSLNALLKSLRKGDMATFLMLCEQEALTLHGLIMSSRTSPVLLKPESLLLISKIREYRQTSGLQVGFTIDAGPNIHLLYHDSIAAQVEDFINAELKPLCENGLVIFDRCGSGPERIKQ